MRNIALWLTLTLIISILGYHTGIKQVIPGPTSYSALMMNQGEELAMTHKFAPKDGFLMLLKRNSNHQSKEI